jgi:hypothetical protein
MDYIPEVLFTEIFLYLPPKELFREICRVNKQFKKSIFCQFFLNSLLKVSSRLPGPPRLDDHLCLKLLKTFESKDSSMKSLFDLLPISTDGGADEDKESFWFGHVFEINERSWCTLENLRNAHASAVLADTQTASKGYYWANKTIVNIVRRWLNSKGQVLSRKNEHIASAIFTHVVTTFPLDAIVIDEPDAEELKTQIRESFINIRPFHAGVRQSRRFPDKQNIHDMKFDRFGADTVNVFGFMKYLDISRKGDFTCPVKTLMVFTSFEFVDVLDTAFQVFNDVCEYVELEKILNLDDSVPSCYPLKVFRGFEYCEFKGTFNKLKPVLWINFTDDCRVDETRVCLEHVVSWKYFYVKLIRPEDRRVERNWNHESMNIDVNYILPRGIVQNLDEIS